MKTLRNFVALFFFSTLCSMTILNATSKPAFNDVAICRIQLKVKTNTIKNANTDSPVWVQLNTKDDPFYLNLGGNDREKGKTDIYDILSSNVNKIGDIKMIKMGIKGGDGWNFREMELIVNGVGIYEKVFSSSGQWIDSNDKSHPKSYTVSTKTLRNYPNWNYNSLTNHIYKAPVMIPVSMITSFVESAVGNSLFNVNKITWGHRTGREYVSVKRINDNTLRFDLDLTYKINNLPDPEVDVDFDLVFSCDNGVIRTSVENYKAKVSGAASYFTSGLRMLKGTLLLACKLPGPGLTPTCKYGLNMIDKLLDFNFSYVGPGNLGVSKGCSDLMKLDVNGNLLLGSTGTPIARKGKSKKGKIIDGTSNTRVLVNRLRKKG
jgi:hypothetical protein